MPPKPPIDTLASMRTRVLPTSFDFGGLTLSLEKAAAKARKSPNENERRQFAPSQRSNLVERMASQPPGASDVQPVDHQQRLKPRPPSNYSSNYNRQQASPRPNSDRGRDSGYTPSYTSGSGSGSGSGVRPDRYGQQSQSRPLRSRLNLPNTATRTDNSTRSASEYIRQVDSLDQLAAEAGIMPAGGGTETAPPVVRGYKARLASRPQQSPSTRFAAAPSAQGGRARRGPGGAGGKGRAGGDGQRQGRSRTRAQENEEARRQAVLARRNAERPSAVPYNFDGIDPAALSPVLARLNETGSKAAYRRFQQLNHDERDAARLVVNNRSIVQKSPMLHKIGVWIPAQENTTKDARA